MSEEPPSWWAKTFESEGRTDDLTARVRRLEFELREEQRRAGEARKESVTLAGRIGRLKSVLEFAVVAAVVPITLLVLETLWRRYSGWELVAIWASAGLTMAYVSRLIGSRINAI